MPSPKSAARIASAALAGTLLLCSAAQGEETLASLLRAASNGGHFEAVGEQELQQATVLFSRLARGEAVQSVSSAAETLALDIVTLPQLIVVREKPEARRGRGLFVFRPPAGKKNQHDILLIPHSFKDEMTREIGLALFAEGHFRAAAWNTVPRRYDRDGKPVDADMAHLSATYFNAFTRAWAEISKEDSFLQLHGFDPAKRRDASAAQAAIILSAGHTNPPSQLRQRWQCLQKAIPGAALYPETTRELGGTTNSQGKLLRAAGNPNFIHAELSREFRVSLLNDINLRRRLLDCLHP